MADITGFKTINGEIQKIDANAISLGANTPNDGDVLTYKDESIKWVAPGVGGSDMKVITCIMNNLTTPILTEYTYDEIMTWINSGKGLSLNIRTISPDNNQISLYILSNFEIYHVSEEPSWLVGKISIMGGTDYIVKIEKASNSDYMQVTLQSQSSQNNN